MVAPRIPCPHCSAALRIRDRSLIGRQVACPDCGQPLLVQSDGPRALKICIPDAAGGAPATADVSASPAGLAASDPPRSEKAAAGRGASWFLAPQFVGWAIAGTVLSGVLGVAFWPQSATPESGENAAVEERPDSASAPGAAKRAQPAGQPAAAERAVLAPRAATEEQIRARLAALWVEVHGFHQAAGRLPGGMREARSLPVQQRFGWMAELQSHMRDDPRTRPQWELSWKDPLNERFVRRSVTEFQNPAHKQLVGESGYPATHFVGMGGVGRDGPELPVTDPRAGAFGYGRTTRLSDFRDGASQTILVAGVSDRLGSWASEGPATIRPATAAPYVNGPDGFSTGEENGMHVLMADGSVRFLNQAIEPQTFRQLVTIAEGVPAQPWEPADKPGVPSGEEPAEQDRVAAADRKAENAPAAQASAEPATRRAPSPENGAAREEGDGLDGVRSILDDLGGPAPGMNQAVAAPRPEPGAAPRNGDDLPPQPELPPPVDLERMLAQKIDRYALAKAVPLNEVLREFEELVLVPIHRKQPLPADAEQYVDSVWQQPVSVSVSNTTVGGILKAILEKAGLTYELGESAIFVLPGSREP